MNTSPLYIALTCDTVNDYFDASLWRGEGVAPMQWRGVEEGIDAMVNSVSHMRDTQGDAPLFTWFPPVDNFMSEEYGDPAWILTNFTDIWNAAIERGDEIGWHVYQHRRDGGQWYPESDSKAWREGLWACYERLRSIGYTPRATRIGGTHCTNAIMKILEDMKIAVDMTALPGRVRRDGFLQLDWTRTPERPYRPSCTDYRVPGNPNVSVLEIPLSMVQVKADYDVQPFRRYIDLSFYHDLLWPGLQSFLYDEPEYLVAIVHPSAVLADVSQQKHGLLSFQIDEFKKNLCSILDYCERSQRPCKFVTATQLEKILLLKGNSHNGH